jgi:SSS family solute:Na+ symporter
MNMQTVDWAILGGAIVFICWAAYATSKHTRSVSDFLAGNRCAGKYLLGVADGIAGLCAISIVALFEMYYKAGFTAVWWQMMMLITMVLVAISGWVQYRYRQTRSMTMAQFFEVRYSRGFRVFAGLLAFVSGTFNFAIFPAVGGRFFQYFCGIPPYMVSLGVIEIDLVFAGIMLFLLTIAVTFTLMGGQVVVMVTDFIQGTFVHFMFVVLSLFLLTHFDWTTIKEALLTAPENASLINPLKTADTENFVTYFLIAVFGIVFTFMAWQGNQGYFCAAKSPHEAKMGRLVASLRQITQALTMVLLPVSAYVLMHHPSYSDYAASANRVLETVPTEQLRSQLTVTVALAKFFPMGLAGAFAAMMFAAFVTTHDTYLHTWGSIFIQDVVLPVRNTLRGEIAPLRPEQHIRWLRVSILGVAIFIFLFSLLFNQQQDIFMYFALTGTIYLGWAGAAIIGGLYWKYGNTAGAWAAAVTGMTLAVAGWYMTYFWPNTQTTMGNLFPGFWSWTVRAWPKLTSPKCPINSQILWFFTMVTSAGVYAVVSLVTGRGRAANMDRILHRGKYAREGTALPARGLRALAMGPEYTLGDRCLVIGSYGYSFLFLVIFLAGTIYALSRGIDDTTWMFGWRIYCYFMFGLSVIISVWLAIGGFHNLWQLLAALRTAVRDDRDDGTVVGDRNLDDLDEEEIEELNIAEPE